MTDRYSEIEEYISTIPRFTTKTELKNTDRLLEMLGNPHKGPKAIHIAGTNGKGSVAKMMSLILGERGFKTGLFISPHLVRLNERISINGTDISDADMVHIFDKVMEVVKTATVEEGSEKIYHPAYFEFLFLMAAVHFAEQKCDYVIYETGLGGRLDATNVILPELSIITSIGLDHMMYLGNTIQAIAGEKAGIIKPDVPVIYNTGDDVADKVIEKRASELGSPSFRVPDAIESVAKSSDSKDVMESFENYIADFSALYQKNNAETALIAELVRTGAKSLGLSGAADDTDGTKNTDITKDTDSIKLVERAMHTFAWAGRMEFVADNILMDGAHNEDAINAFVKSVKHLMEVTKNSKGEPKWKRISLLFAVSSDKDYDSIVRVLSENLDFEDVYVGELDSVRRQDAGEVVKLFQKYMPAEKHFDIVGMHSIESAWKLATGELLEDTLLVIVGSLYMVGEIKDIINRDK